MKFSLSKFGFFGIIALCFFIFVAIRIVEAKKPAPKPEEPLELYGKNIVTTTPIGEIMRVWGSSGINADYENIWNKEGERYKAVVLGDIDGTSDQRELYAASVNYICQGRGKNRECDYRIVVDVYRKGESGIKLSSPEVWDRSCVNCELILADVCGGSESEIILSTDHNVVVFGYDGTEIKQLAYKDDIGNGIFTEQKYWIYTMAVADIDTDLKDEILLGVNPGGYDAGYLFNYKLEEKSPPNGSEFPYSLKEVSPSYHCPDGMRIYSLGTGYDNEETFKICATAFVYLEPWERIFQNYLLIWNWDESLIFEGDGLIDGQTSSWFSLDVGNVLEDTSYPGYPGEEIVLIRNDSQPGKLELYSLDGISLNLVAPAFSEEVSLYNVYIADSDNDGSKEIICVGGAAQKTGKGGKGGICGSYYYIEVFGVSDGAASKIESEWWIIDGDRRKDEAPWDASIG
jgi:hypothetical protein